MSQVIYVILFISTIPVSLLLMLISLYDLKKVSMSPVEHAKTNVSFSYYIDRYFDISPLLTIKLSY